MPLDARVFLVPQEKWTFQWDHLGLLGSLDHREEKALLEKMDRQDQPDHSDLMGLQGTVEGRGHLVKMENWDPQERLVKMAPLEARVEKANLASWGPLD